VQPRRGRRGRCSGPPEAALLRPAPSRPRPSCAALPSAEACPPYGDRRGPRCARQAPGHASTAAQTAPVAYALGRGGGSARPLRCAPACGSPARTRAQGGRMAPRCAKPWARPEGRGVLSAHGLASGRNARQGRKRRASLSRTPPVSALRLGGCAASRAPTAPAGAPLPAPWTTPTAGAVCASLRSLPPTPRGVGSAPCSRSDRRREPPGSPSSPCAGPSPRREPRSGAFLGLG
jgi:hypothetical protein